MTHDERIAKALTFYQENAKLKEDVKTAKEDIETNKVKDAEIEEKLK